MKNYKSLLTNVAAVALVAGGTLTTHAQTWQTMDDFQLTAGCRSTGGDVGADIQGNVYYVGSGNTTADGSLGVALVHVSADQGMNWTTLPQSSEPGWSWAHYRGFASDTSGRLYFCGNGRLEGRPSTDLGWIIRESVDGGANWFETDDPFPFPGDTYAGCADIQVSPSGDVYASGSSLLYGWVVRKRAAGATEFTTVDSSGQNNPGSGWAIGFHPTRGVFVVGDPSLKWWVRRSASGDAGTWTVADSFYSSTEWTQGAAKDIVVTGSGTIHVAGWAYSSKTRKRHWIVRSSTDGGVTWAISDNFNYGGASLSVVSMTLDATEKIFVCGQAANNSGNLYWLVRKGTPGTKLVKQGGKWVQVPTVTWTTSDVFQLASGKAAAAQGITGDAFGNVFATGFAGDAIGVDHAIVRKLTP